MQFPFPGAVIFAKQVKIIGARWIEKGGRIEKDVFGVVCSMQYNSTIVLGIVQIFASLILFIFFFRNKEEIRFFFSVNYFPNLQPGLEESFLLSIYH